MTGYSGGSVTASFLYDGDGKRVQATVNGVTTQFVGSHVEWQSSTSDMVRYYYTGGVRVAMRTGDDGLVWLVGDHLGSTSIAVTDASGATERQGYKAWGETRFGSLPTKYQYTGQRNEPELGLYYYGARWYDSDLGRWTQPDSIIPGNQGIQAWDRYAYANNNTLKYTDPSGHQICLDDGYCGNPDNVGYQKHIYTEAIEDVFMWHLHGKWTLQQLKILYETGYDIQTYIDKLTDGKGLAWMNKYMGNVHFVHFNKFDSIFPSLYGFVPSPTGYPAVYLSQTDVTKANIAHELGHVLDNSTGNGVCASTYCGGGAADELAKFVGGDPSGLRWANGTSGIPPEMQWPKGAYGNTSTADYFADVFSFMLYVPNKIPDPSILLWMQTVIALQANEL
jgi:RHS repeat-associated protein